MNRNVFNGEVNATGSRCVRFALCCFQYIGIARTRKEEIVISVESGIILLLPVPVVTTCEDMQL